MRKYLNKFKLLSFIVIYGVLINYVIAWSYSSKSSSKSGSKSGSSSGSSSGSNYSSNYGSNYGSYYGSNYGNNYGSYGSYGSYGNSYEGQIKNVETTSSTNNQQTTNTNQNNNVSIDSVESNSSNSNDINIEYNVDGVLRKGNNCEINFVNFGIDTEDYPSISSIIVEYKKSDKTLKISNLKNGNVGLNRGMAFSTDKLYEVIEVKSSKDGKGYTYKVTGNESGYFSISVSDFLHAQKLL